MARIVLNTVALDPLRWANPKRRFFELVDLIEPITAATGFGGLEVWQYHLSGLSADELADLKARLDVAGLSVEVLGLYPSLAGPTAASSVAEAAHLMAAASTLGAHSVKIFVGDQASETISDDHWHESLRHLDELIRVADEHGLKLDGETHQNTLFDDLLSLEHTVAAVGEGRMGVCFQPYDFSDSHGTIEVLRKLAPDVRHVHFQGRTRDGVFCLLEDAPIDYRRLLGILARSGFDGTLSVEFVKDCVVDSPEKMDLSLVLANAEKDRQYLARVATEAGLTLR